MQKTESIHILDPISTICWNRESRQRRFWAAQLSSQLCGTWPAVAESRRERELPSNRAPRRQLPVNFWASTPARGRRSAGWAASARRWRRRRRGTCSSEGWTRSRGSNSRSEKKVYFFTSVCGNSLWIIFIASLLYNIVTEFHSNFNTILPIFVCYGKLNFIWCSILV